MDNIVPVYRRWTGNAISLRRIIRKLCGHPRNGQKDAHGWRMGGDHRLGDTALVRSTMLL